MSDVKKLTKIRAGHRADVTKKLSQAKAIMENFQPTGRSELEALHNVLLTKDGLLKELNTRMIDVMLEDEGTEDDAISAEISAASDIEITIQITLEDIKKELKWVRHPNEDDNRSVSSGSSTNSEKKRSAKLPKIEIEKFGGDPKKWQEWWDAFNSLVHTDDELSEYNKFYYLRSYLVGDAKNAIAGLQATEANYEHAVQILKDRFGKKSLVISSHMEALMKVSALSDTDNTKTIRRAYDRIECHIRSLQALGLDSANYGCVLGPVILSHLPDELRLTVTRNFDATGDVWELDDILKALKTEIEVRERSGFVASKKSNKGDHSKGAASTLMTKSEDAAGNSSNGPNCLFCNGKHSTYKCKVVTDVEAKRQHLRKKARCFNCLGPGHIAVRCKSQKVCAKCGSKHDTSLCDSPAATKDDDVRGGNEEDKEGAKEKVEEKKPPAKGLTVFCNTATSVLMLTARAAVSNVDTGEKVYVRMIFDNCSNRSYITNKLRERLKLPKIDEKQLNVSRFMDSENEEDRVPIVKLCNIVQLKIEGVKEDDNIVVTLTEVPEICPPPHSEPVEIYKEQFQHLEGLDLADEVVEEPFRGDNIDVMLGLDWYYSIVDSEQKRGICGPVATKSRVGWLAAGPIFTKTDKRDPPMMSCLTMADDHSNENLNDLVKNFWSLEAIGIKEEDTEDVLKRFEETTWFNEETGKYRVSLPWRDTSLQLADNYQLCLKYLLCRLMQFRKDPKLWDDVKKVFDQQLEAGVLEHVPPEPPEVGKAYYLPQHYVIKPERLTTKIRVVANASSSMVGPTLNQCIYKGPSLMPDLLRVLLGFSCHRIAVVADLEKAFLNVEMNESDRDYQRVIWVKNFDPDKSDQEVEFVHLRFTVCVFGMSSSPFHLMATTKHHTDKYRKKCPEIVSEIQRSLFVDDLNSGADTVKDASELYNVSKRIFKDGGFKLRKFATNSAELRAKVEKEERGMKEIDDKSESYAELTTQQSIEEPQPVVEQKVLGNLWNKELDCWIFRFDKLLEIAKQLKRTKRGLLKLFPRIFDPRGLISPISIPIKRTFQKTCVDGLEWDDTLSKEQIEYVEAWLQDLEAAGEIRFPRYCLKYKRSELKSVHIIGFGDASTIAYGGVIYVRVESNEGVDVNIVLSKARVAPPIEMSVPRLELIGCLCLSRLMKLAKEVLQEYVPIANVHYFTDSMTALCWIQNEVTQYKQFVEERSKKIRKLSGKEQWKHVKGTENPADIASRGAFASQLKDNEFWEKGPDWLMLPPDKWPVKIRDIEHTTESIEEMKVQDKKKVAFTMLSWNAEEVIDSTRYGSMQKLLRVTAYAKRFIHNKFCKQTENLRKGELSAEELKEAELLWVHSLQKGMKKDSKFSRIERQLNVYTDETGLLRSKGRLEKSQLLYNQKCPVLLPRRHHFVKLLVIDAHWRVMHSGVNATMAFVRESYWIPQLRQITRSLLHKCIICRWIEGRAYSYPKIPPLPESRVVMDEPFSTTGIDYAGPLYVKTVEMQHKNSKVYILLFTCTTSRAVHLELTPDLGSPACVRGLRRFIARRGVPTMIISDNAKTFKSKDIDRFVADRRISWKYNVPRAPWTGGFFERMVKSTKSCLKKVLMNNTLTYEELETVLIEVENVINNRPLTYFDTDSTEDILTPNHLIYGRSLPIANRELPKKPINANKPKFKKRVLYKQKVLQDFRKRWETEYLASLRATQQIPKTKQLRYRVLAT